MHLSHSRSERGVNGCQCDCLCLLVLAAVNVGLGMPVQGAVWYVDDDAAAGGDGQSWGTAFKYLQDALSAAQLDPNPEIWIAGGKYRPDQGANVTLGDRLASFHLGTNMRIYGGFAGTESSINERDLSDRSRATILSGDLLENDGPDVGSFDENSIHVLVASFVTADSTLHGLTFSGGFADEIDGYETPPGGGGMYASESCSARIQYCVFENNRRGAIYVGSGWPTFLHCRFIRNSGRGDVVEFAEDDPSSFATVMSCEFIENDGWGVWRSGRGLAHFYACRFARNQGGSILSLSVLGGLVANSTFLDNYTDVVLDYHSYDDQLQERLEVRNCIFRGNTSEVRGSGEHVISWDPQNNNRNFSFNVVQGLTGSWVGVGNRRGLARMTTDGHILAGSIGIDSADSAALGVDILDLDVDGDLTELIPLDVDGEPRLIDDPSEANTGSGLSAFLDTGADEYLDSDVDGLPDYWERRFFGDTTSGDPFADSDGDGLSNRSEFEYYGSDPVAAPIFVAVGVGSDEFDGSSLSPEGPSVGPKATLQGALDVANGGDTILVAAGTYPVSQFQGLDFRKESIVLRSIEGPDSTSIEGNYIDWRSIEGTNATIEGFAFSGDSGILVIWSGFNIINCVIENVCLYSGCSLELEQAHSRLQNVLLDGGQSSNANAAQIVSSILTVDGEVRLGGPAVLWESWIDGSGTLILDRSVNSSTRLHITSQYALANGGIEPPSSTTTLHSIAVRGTGDIDIDPGETMLLESGALIDLSGEDVSDECLDPAESANWGTITVNGALIVRDSTIRNTNVVVEGGELGDSTQIISNEINLIQNPPGWGGEFFVEGTSMIECNIIRSDGDRYLDLDPDPNAAPRPVIGQGLTANRIFVTIMQGAGLDQGELLELRSRDLDNVVNSGLSGVYELASSDGYSDTWVLERLEVMPDAKVTLTNRQGFVYQDPAISVPEALYVKEVRLHPGAVLNTGLQRLYYQQLLDENGQELVRDPVDPTAPLSNGARFEDVPLLGYSLKTIAMEDDTEFGIRIRRRIRDPHDSQPCECLGTCSTDLSECKEGSVLRIEDPLAPSNGVMAMKTHAEDRESASSVAAHGAFARAGEDEILVTFLYR
ncbi:MAG: hypothetical protein MI923_10655, partial [Phycisphaerales bacterium]|nr:hypothetical protein [Phycisphaerales bacterium]